MRLIHSDSAISGLRQDVSYAVRMFRQSPGFTAVAVISLALGIGANTAIFSLIDAVLLKLLPVSSPQELVVPARNPSHPEAGYCYPDYEFIRDHNSSYSGVIAYNGTGPVAFSAGDGPDTRTQVAGVTMVSGNYFDVLGVHPKLGRVLNVEDNRKEGAAAYQRGQVVGIVLRDALTMVLTGSLVGVCAALALTRLASAFLYGMTPRDPATFVLATSVLVAVTVVASYIPGHRAGNVDPMVALRDE